MLIGRFNENIKRLHSDICSKYPEVKALQDGADWLNDQLDLGEYVFQKDFVAQTKPYAAFLEKEDFGFFCIRGSEIKWVKQLGYMQLHPEMTSEEFTNFYKHWLNNWRFAKLIETMDLDANPAVDDYCQKVQRLVYISETSQAKATPETIVPTLLGELCSAEGISDMMNLASNISVGTGAKIFENMEESSTIVEGIAKKVMGDDFDPQEIESFKKTLKTQATENKNKKFFDLCKELPGSEKGEIDEKLPEKIQEKMKSLDLGHLAQSLGGLQSHLLSGGSGDLSKLTSSILKDKNCMSAIEEIVNRQK